MSIAFIYNTWSVVSGLGGLSLIGYYFLRRKKDSITAAALRAQQEKLEDAQQALVESNKRFAYAAQAASDAIWDRNYSDDTVFWGEGYRTLFGYDINDETASIRFWESKVHPEDFPTVAETICAAKNDPSVNSWTCEYRFMKANGEYAFVREKSVIFRDEHGHQVRAIGALQDVTEARQRHVAEMDKAVAHGKFEIVSDVMHDIGNAVVGFGSYLTRMRRLQDAYDVGNLANLAAFFQEHKASISEAIGEARAAAIVKILDGITDTLKSNQQEIGKSITEQLGIISHIQEILSIQRQYIAGRETQNRKPVNVRNIINDSMAMVFSAIDRKGIGITLNIISEKPVINGDRTKLMQLMLNILRNSVEAIDEHAPEKNIAVTVKESNGQLMIQVQDTGHGFTREIADRLFERGFTTKASGPGLGLHTCRTIAGSHEGTIDLNSKGPGRGALATIRFTLS